ncbi:PAS domain-containing sensor histidine kinase [Pelagibacterium sp. HS1C4-1]|nr:PAS domain-containing sensor histidine kinase [Pelagibacterium xiamenense]
MWPDGRIVKVNATLCDWLGRSREDIIGKRLRDLLNVAGSIFFETHFAPMLRMQGFFHEVALEMVRADGSHMPVLANAAERRDAEGNLQFTRLTVFKATERRQYERELVEARAAERAARQRLEDMVSSLREGMSEQVAILMEEKRNSELKEQFVAVLGHDLRNPLAAIDAGASKLLRDGGWTESTPTILHLMKNSVSRMGGLIDNVLDLARSRLGGGIALDLADNRPLQLTLELVIEEIKSVNPDRTIDVCFDIVAPVRVDHDRIAQMFSNLLGNAITHGMADTTIKVSCMVDETGALELSVANAADPIPPEMVELLFQPFHRGQVRNNARGLGLGLYIASEIAKAHGGWIDVVSEPDETRFIFRLPAQAADAAQERARID